MKKKRIVDKELLAFVRTLPCIICRKIPSDPDHITTRGAGGDDVAINIWPVCRDHHTERHNKGLPHMIRTYRSCEIWLTQAGREDVLEKARRHEKRA